jgi:mRNA interferase MazF
MKFARGDVVLVDFSFSGGGASKVRPALVVQNDRDNARLKNTVVAMITSRTSRAATERTQLFIDIGTPDGRQSGLIMNSAVNCVNLFTLEQTKVLRRLGRLTRGLKTKNDSSLKAAFEIP